MKYLFYDFGNELSALLFAAFIDGVRRNRPLCHLDADTILAGLKGNEIAADVDDLADHSADRRDLIPYGEIVAHFFCFLFLLVFRTDQEEVKDGDHHNENEDDDESADDCTGNSEAPRFLKETND